MSQPLRGEVWLADLGMVAKVRPVLVMSMPYGDKDYALFHVVPHTTSVRNSQFEVVIDVRGLQAGAFNVQGSQSIPGPALLRRLVVLSPDEMEAIEEAMLRWLGIARAA